MRRYKVLMTEPAVDDLQEIGHYISKDLKEPGIALKLVRKIKGAVMSLAEMPSRYALMTDERLAERGIRKLPLENYIVFYVISEKDMIVTVVRILHGRRYWEHLL